MDKFKEKQFSSQSSSKSDGTIEVSSTYDFESSFSDDNSNTSDLISGSESELSEAGEQSDNSKLNSDSDCKRNKVEEQVRPTPISTSFGSKAVFGSAAKNIVSFNSVGAPSNLPSKNLFAEEFSEKTTASVSNEDAAPHFDIITGEEEEITIISMKGKLFEFNSESKDWHERGIGIFKLNKALKTEKYRIIMRTDGVQKLILNSNLFPKMICELVQEKNFRFSANNFDSKIQTFILRLKTADDAENLEKAFKNAINEDTK